jgi:hypothetical protein
VPAGTIKQMCGGLLQKFKIQMILPGLLFIDTPGTRLSPTCVGEAELSPTLRRSS